jgi:replication factor A1
MEEQKYAPHVTEIVRVLENKKTEKEIEKELKKYVETYMVPLSEAKRSIVKKYGGDLTQISAGVQKTLIELKPSENNVDLLCRVVSVNPKEVTVDGKTKKIHYGIVGDQTRTLPFTAWEEFEFEKGDVIRVSSAYTKDWQGTPQINFGTKTRITKESKDALPAYTPKSSQTTKRKIKELRAGMSNVSVTGRILSIEKRTVKVKDIEKDVFSGTIADETGKISFSCWHDFDLSLGDVVDIAGGYTKSWKGIPQFNFDGNAKVEKADSDAIPKLDDLLKDKPITIEELSDIGGAAGILVRGVILDVKSGSGLILRCPECDRVLQKGACAIHGTQEGNPDLRIKATLDDGTGALSVVLGKEITEEMLGKTLEDCKNIAKEKMSAEVIQDMLRELLVTKPIEVHGNVTSDDFGLMLIGKKANLLKMDVQKEALKLAGDLEEVV